MCVYILQGSQRSPSRRKDTEMERERADVPHYGLNPQQKENRALSADLFPAQPKEEKGKKPGTYLTEPSENKIQATLEKAAVLRQGLRLLSSPVHARAGGSAADCSSGLGREEDTPDPAQVGTIAAAAASFPTRDLRRDSLHHPPPPSRPQAPDGDTSPAASPSLPRGLGSDPQTPPPPPGPRPRTRGGPALRAALARPRSPPSYPRGSGRGAGPRPAAPAGCCSSAARLDSTPPPPLRLPRGRPPAPLRSAPASRGPLTAAGACRER